MDRPFARKTPKFVLIVASLLPLFGCPQISPNTKPTPGGSFTWAKQAHGNITSSLVTTLSDGSSVVSGAFFGPVTFGAGEPNEITFTETAKFYDVVIHYNGFVCKYDPTGAVAWAKNLRSPSNVQPLSMAAFSDDSVLVLCESASLVTFDAGTESESTLDPKGVFVAKYSAAGQLLWTKALRFQSSFTLLRIKVLPDDSFYVAGKAANPVTFGDGEPAETTFAEGNDTSFVARYNADGTLAWAQRIKGTASSSVTAIGVTGDESVIVGGGLSSCCGDDPANPQSWVFGEGQAGETELLIPQFGTYAAKYLSDGTLEWAKLLFEHDRDGQDGIGFAYLDLLALSAASDGSFFMSGEFASDVTLGHDEPTQTLLHSVTQPNVNWEAWVAKFNADGTLAWARQTAPMQPTALSGENAARDVAALADGGCVITGEMSPPTWRDLALHLVGTRFNPDLADSVTVVASQPTGDLFTARYDTSGGLKWVKHAKGAGSHLAVAPDEHSIRAVGTYQYSTIFGLGESNQTRLTTSYSAMVLANIPL